MPEPMAATHRQVTYRLLPGSRARARRLAATAGACRFVWNRILDDQDQLYTIARMCGAAPPPVSYFALSAAFKQLRDATPWLGELPFAPVPHTLKYQAEAWQRFFRGEAGRPRFKGRRGADSVTLPTDIRIRDGQLRFPKIGWMRLRRRGSGSNDPYPDGRPVRAVVKRDCGKWYAVVCYEIAAVERQDDGTAVGVDMNAGQVATSAGDIHRLPDLRRLEARKRRYQRKMAGQKRGSRRREKTRARLARTQRRIAMTRRAWQHRTSRRIAAAAHSVCVEELNTRGMTASAKGSVEAPGRNVEAKAGLNREILNTGWADLRRMLDYKAGRVVAVDPAFTSQTCAACGAVDGRSRRSQARFRCVACGHADHADLNAAREILRRGLGEGGIRAGRLPGCRAEEPRIDPDFQGVLHDRGAVTPKIRGVFTKGDKGDPAELGAVTPKIRGVLT